MNNWQKWGAFCVVVQVFLLPLNVLTGSRVGIIAGVACVFSGLLLLLWGGE